MTALRRYTVAVAPLVVRDVRTPRTVVHVEAFNANEAKHAALRRVLDGADLDDHPASACIACARICWVDRDLEIPA